MTTSKQPWILVTAPPDDQASVPSRRQFCAHACQAASLVALGGVLSGCGGGSSPTSPDSPSTGNSALPVVSGSVSGRTVSVPVGAGTALAAAGSAALVSSSLGPFLVFRSATTSFSVLTAVCTHEGCTVELFNGQLFVCPCHNSKYTTAGAVANGPAMRSLTTFPSALSGDVLTFTA